MKLCFNVFVNLTLLFAVTATADSKNTKPASEYFKLCRRGDAKALNECVKQNLIDLRPQLMKGIKGLGLVPLEPLVVPRMELSQGGGALALNTVLTNLTIHGMGEYTVKSVNVLLDKEKYTAEITTTFPELIMTSKYSMSGQILVIPIQGEGNCEMNFTDVSTVSHTTGRVVERDGLDFIDISRVSWDIVINGRSRSWFYNLFNGDQQLGNATNMFLNDNSHDAFEAYKHLPEEAFGQVFKGLSSKVFDLYPIKELFLD